MNLLPGEIIGTGGQTTVRLEGGGTAISAAPSSDSQKGLKVNVGVRPEDFVEAGDDFIYEGNVEFTEALGEVTLLHFAKIDGQGPIIGKLPGIHLDRGKTLKMTAVPDKVQVFHEGRSLHYI